MGVLAIAQVGDLLVGLAPVRRKALVGAQREPRRDRGVVARGECKRFSGEPLARGEREAPPGLPQLREHAPVVGGIHDDRGERVVLGGSADHGRPTDVDVLDNLRGRGVAAGDRLLERVEVHADEVHRFDPVLGGGVKVLLAVAQREQPRVEARVQRLHAPIHHLGKAGEVLDRAHRDPSALKLAGGATGRDDLHAQRGEATGEVDESGLVGHRQQRATNPHLSGRCALPARGRSRLGGHQSETISPERRGRGIAKASRLPTENETSLFSMSSLAASDIVELAGAVARRVTGVRAGILFGSWARGTAIPPLSDIDVLLFVKDRAASSETRKVAAALTRTPLSVLVHDHDSLSQLSRSDWSFVEHLRLEHLPVYGDIDALRLLLRPSVPRAHTIRAEIASHLPAVVSLREPSRLAGRHLLAYSRLYGAAKSAAILDGLLQTDVTFDRRLALQNVAARRPELVEPIRQIERLEPFWLRMRRSEHVQLPWSPRHDLRRLSAQASATASVLRELSRGP